MHRRDDRPLPQEIIIEEGCNRCIIVLVARTAFLVSTRSVRWSFIP
jgi:hypothetical protein